VVALLLVVMDEGS